MKRLLAGGALGALAMYFLDPQGGRRRRARTRDKVVHAAHVINEAGKVTARDTVHRAAGMWAGTKRLFQRGDISDQALVGRVHTWTVNDPARARELALLGVDCLISDNPGALKQALETSERAAANAPANASE